MPNFHALVFYLKQLYSGQRDRHPANHGSPFIKCDRQQTKPVTQSGVFYRCGTSGQPTTLCCCWGGYHGNITNKKFVYIVYWKNFFPHFSPTFKFNILYTELISSCAFFFFLNLPDKRKEITMYNSYSPEILNLPTDKGKRGENQTRGKFPYTQ